ncbi:MAG TPA: hypothetical protein VEI97_10610 [bacterium]|nr:hypothetical protein [bacterium]
MRRSGGKRSLVVAAMATGLALAACGDGEDRPGSVSRSGSVSGTGTGSASGHQGEEHQHGPGSAKRDFDRSQATAQVTTILRDFVFVDVPVTVTGPKVFFEAKNEGPTEHELVIFDESGTAMGGIEPFPKGETKALAVELAPGRYAIRCLIQLGDRTHVQLGMESAFTVS